MVEMSLAVNKKKFDDHIQKKIDKLGERTRYINYKFEDVRYYFRKYSITIIYLATLLTLIEALMNSLPIEEIENIFIRNVIRFIPLLLSSSISLLAALIKFNKYEDKIENITRTTEKCITTMAKLKNIKEQLYFSTSNKKIVKLITIFLNTIYHEYLESNTSIEKQLLDTDYAIYMKKVANNDIKRHEIMLYRSEHLKKNSNGINNQERDINNINSRRGTNSRNRRNFSMNRHPTTNITRRLTSMLSFNSKKSTFAKSSHAREDVDINRFGTSSHAVQRQNSIEFDTIHEPQKKSLSLTDENIRNSTNSVVIDIKNRENSDDDISQDYSQFAPSSKGSDEKSFAGSINSLLDSDNSKSQTSNNKFSNQKKSDKSNEDEIKIKASNYIRNKWKIYKYNKMNKIV